MDKKNSINTDFASLFKDAKPVKQDRYVMSKKERLAQLALKKTKNVPSETRREGASIEISDEFEAYWPVDKPLSFLRYESDIASEWVKKLMRAMIPPDLEVDLHGLRAMQAKKDILSAISEATKHNYICIQIIHGHGNGVLKHKTPNWLVQHPEVAAFVRAPKQYGGNSAILVLITKTIENLKS